MLNKASYSPKAISTFDIVGTYFVRIYYNDFYNKAVEMKDKQKAASITDAYKKVMKRYLAAFTSKPPPRRGKFSNNQRTSSLYYHKIVTDVHSYYQLCSGYSTVSLNEFINNVVEQLVPKEYYEILNNNKKDRIFHHAITNALTSFTVYIAQEHLSNIIDARHKKQNMRMYQDKFIDLLILEREKLYTQLVRQATSPSRNGSDVPLGLVKRMRDEIKKHIEDNCKLNAKIASAATLVKELKNQIVIRDSEIRSLKDQIAALQRELAQRSTVVRSPVQQTKPESVMPAPTPVETPPPVIAPAQAPAAELKVQDDESYIISSEQYEIADPELQIESF